MPNLSKTLGLICGVAALALPFAAFAQTVNPYEGMDKDEAGLWYTMDKAEAKVKTSGARIHDAALNAYVKNLTCDIVGPDCEKLRIYLINSPEFNALMAPNGMMMVSSGLLLRAENEAQLGCVIGHEYGHFLENHSLEQWRGLKNVGVTNLFIPIAGALIGMASLSDFSRDQEREADEIGFRLTSGKGYVPGECSDVWLNLIGENAVSDNKRTRKSTSKTKHGVFSSHPVAKERVETLKALAESTEGGDKTGRDVYQAATVPHLAKWLDNELLAKDYSRHIYLFEQLKDRGRHAATLNFYLGEAYRLRRQDGDKTKALSYWQEAATLDGAPPLVWRNLAEYERRSGDKTKALEYYNRYLSEAPDAADKPLIQKYIDRLSKEN